MTSQTSQARVDAGLTEPCFKCQGSGGQYEAEGPYTVFMPCYRCGTTGQLALGTLAEEVARQCPDCAGAGGQDEQNWEDPQPGGAWRNCRTCRGTGDLRAPADR